LIIFIRAGRLRLNTIETSKAPPLHRVVSTLLPPPYDRWL
jgi:hypothetical protein